MSVQPPEKSKIRNIIFDLGGVLITFNPREYLRQVLDEEEQNACFTLVFQSPEWTDLDRGRLTVLEAKRILLQRHPTHRPSIERVFASWFDLFRPIPSTLALAEELLERGYDLYILSNCIRETYEYFRPNFPLFERCKGVVVSYRLGIIKPEKEIYEYLLNTYRLNPSECLFIDDMEANVDGARAMGIPSVRFESCERLREELVRRGIL